MQRFVLILDGSITNNTIPEWVHNLHIEHLPYCLRFNIALLTNEWLSIDEFQSKIKSLCNTNIEEPSFTTFASIIHNSCCKLKKYLNNNNTHYKLELIWRFPTFNKHIQYETVHDDLVSLCGAFERWIKCNNGHIHIIIDDVVNTDDINNNSFDVNLCDINSYKTLFCDDCTVWKPLKGITFNHVLIGIIKPYCLNSVRLKMKYEDCDRMDVDRKEKEEEEDVFNFSFDLIPTFLSDQHSELMWKDWDHCYDWNTMKLLNVIDASSFPMYLLMCDMKWMLEYTQNEPIVMILNAQNETAKLLSKYWINNDCSSMRWIVQFMNDNNNNKLAHNIFMNQDEWMNLYVNNGVDNDDNDNDDNCGRVSSKYLVYPVYIKNEMRLIAHRIMSDHQINGNILNLTYKYSSDMNITDNNDIVQVSLPYFGFNTINCDLNKEAECISIRVNNSISSYNNYLNNKHCEYMSSVLLNENIIQSKMPSCSSSSSSFIESMTMTRNNNKNKRIRRRKKSLTNRGIIALQNAAKQSNIIQSAHLISRKKQYSKRGPKRKIDFNVANDNDNIWHIFDENGALRDVEREKYFYSISQQSNALRRDWRKLREIAQNGTGKMNGNWPIKSRFYNAESIKYEEQISRIKKQYVNGMNNGNDNSFEIIGDLAIYNHPITIKSSPKLNNNNNIILRNQNKCSLQSEIEVFLRAEINKNKDCVRYRKVRNAIFDAMWKGIKKDENMNYAGKMHKQTLKDYVSKNFVGMFSVFDGMF